VGCEIQKLHLNTFSFYFFEGIVKRKPGRPQKIANPVVIPSGTRNVQTAGMGFGGADVPGSSSQWPSADEGKFERICELVLVFMKYRVNPAEKLQLL